MKTLNQIVETLGYDAFHRHMGGSNFPLGTVAREINVIALAYDVHEEEVYVMVKDQMNYHIDMQVRSFQE